MIRNDDPAGEIDRISEFRTAEPAVYHRQAWKVLFQAGPKPDAGTTHKDDAIFGRRIRPVAGFEGRDLGLPFARILERDRIRRKLVEPETRSADQEQQRQEP